MKVGMLWFDNSKQRDLDTKIERATSYYEKKYGQKPNVCFVHPSMVAEEEKPQAQGIEIRSMTTVLPNHFWIGVNGKDSEKSGENGKPNGNGNGKGE